MKIIFLCFLAGIATGAVMKRLRTKVFKGPRSSVIKREKHYDDDGKCYSFVPVIHVCPPNINVGDFSHSEDSED